MKRINSRYAGLLLLNAAAMMVPGSAPTPKPVEGIDLDAEMDILVYSEIRAAKMQQRPSVLRTIPRVFSLLNQQPGLAEAILAFHSDLSDSATVLYLQQCLLGNTVELQKLLAEAVVIGRYQQAMDWHAQEGTPNIFFEDNPDSTEDEDPEADGPDATGEEATDTAEAYLKLAEEAEAAGPAASAEEALKNIGKATKKK